eukprot:Hpha_TRINITY_DN2419_c0_g1::TRINITY_DN2419_c0_g1_i1::g.24607::m.24607/K12860/CDC5L, CDC5, CEF1; pre-mRNA-splicing factor CDC5/CEF1
MRIFIKGGTWKNHEDEILKAAVMKYGKNQWARIASLLPRKSAKQCKARWYEWLDPSIKKTEWTREEEEKLLHLAKIMPCQWLTIAPIVGRTPHQCLEHYEKLLDQAQEHGEGYDPADDPRRLRPGEIDPNPEVKPPRPDALDMDDDEKEMLNEARARLANTRGKKAKRKMREKQLDEARRLSALQKRRELKAAGIDTPAVKRRFRRGIDYANEIPFWKQTPAGFFDTSEELKRTPQITHLQDGDKKDAAHRDAEERKKRKEDKKKQALAKKENLAEHFDKVNKINDPSGMVRRSELVLPEAQVSERELESVQKLGPDMLRQLQQERSAAGERTPAVVDSVAMMARDQVLMKSAQTPLVGGETPITSERFHDFKGVAPQSVEQPTPNLIHAQLTPRTASGMPPPGATPVRDSLRINEAGGFTPSATPSSFIHAGGSRSAREARFQEKLARAKLEADFSRLPSPKDEVEIQPQLTPAQVEALQAPAPKGVEQIAPDSADVEATRKRKREAQKEAKAAGSTQAVRRGLPRPSVAVPPSRSDQQSPLDAARNMLEREVQLLIANDAHHHPLGKRAGRAVSLDYFSEAALTASKLELHREEDRLKAQSPFFEDRQGDWCVADPQWLAEQRAACADELLFVPNPSRIAHTRKVSLAARLSAVQHEFEGVLRQVASKAQHAGALEKKVTVLTTGYLRRCEALSADLTHTWSEAAKTELQLRAFQELRRLEQAAIHNRTSSLEKEVEYLKSFHSQLQSAYEAVKRDNAELREWKLAQVEALKPPQLGSEADT